MPKQPHGSRDAASGGSSQPKQRHAQVARRSPDPKKQDSQIRRRPSCARRLPETAPAGWGSGAQRGCHRVKVRCVRTGLPSRHASSAKQDGAAAAQSPNRMRRMQCMAPPCIMPAQGAACHGHTAGRRLERTQNSSSSSMANTSGIGAPGSRLASPGHLKAAHLRSCATRRNIARQAGAAPGSGPSRTP